MSKLTIQRGCPYTRTITLTYKATGLPYDLTGKTVLFTARKLTDTALTDTDAVIKKSITSHTDPENGSTTLSLSVAETSVPEDNYKYDFRVMSGETVVGNSLPDIAFVISIVTTRTS